MATSADYALIGSYDSRFLPIERVPTGIINRVSETDSIKHLNETDIDFVESLYRNSNPDYYMGAWFVKAVSDVILEFMCGKLPKISANDDRYTKFCNLVWNQNGTRLYEMFRELGLFGQEWMYVGYDRVNGIPRYRPLTRKNIVDIRYENFDDPDDITFIRIRDTFQDYSNLSGTGDDDVNAVDVPSETENLILFDKLFWKELNPEYEQYLQTVSVIQKPSRQRGRKKSEPSFDTIPDQWIYYMRILKRDSNNSWTEYQTKRINPMGVIPVIEFNQNRMSTDKSGYSDLSGALRIVGVYHQILETMVNNDLYNLQPTLKFTGIDGSPIDFVRSMYGREIKSGDTLEDNGTYGLYGAYYLPSSTDVNWLSTPDNTSSSASILEKLFYIMMQVTGVPEWALGAHIQGAWATVRQQSIPLMQKIRAKRMDVNDDLLKLCSMSAIVMQFYHPNEDYTFPDQDAEIMWSDVLTRESSESLSIMEALLNHNLITEETALSLIDIVSDPVKELELAREAKRNSDEEQDIDSQVTERVNSKVIGLFKRRQTELLESGNPQQKKAAGEMLSLSDDAVGLVFNAMIESGLFDSGDSNG